MDLEETTGPKGNCGSRACRTDACPVLDLLLGAVGAVAGGALGYLLFFAIARHGFYAMVLPGALAGLCCGALSGRKSVPLGILCGILGLAAGVLTEWRFAPFVKDHRLSFFLAHLHQLNRVSQIMIALGGGFAFWFGLGREGGVWPRRRGRPVSS